MPDLRRMCFAGAESASLKRRLSPGSRTVGLTYSCSLSIVAVGALTGVLTARALGAEGKGELAIVQAIVGLAGAVGSLSVDQSYVYYASRARSRNMARHALLTGFVLGCIASGVVTLLAALNSTILPTGHPALYVIGAMSLPFGLSGLCALGVLQGSQMFLAWNALRTIPPVSYLLVLLGFQFTVGITPFRAIIALVAGSIVFWTITAAFALRASTACASPTVSWRRILSYGGRTHAAAVQSLLNQRVDISIMGFLTGAATVGRYSVAVSLVAPLAMIGPAVADYLFPRLAATTGAQHIGGVMVRLGVPLALCAGLWALLAPALLGPVFGPSFRQARLATMILCGSMLPLALGYIFTAWWKSRGQPQRVIIAEAAALGLTCVLLPALVPTFAESGAAITSLVAYATSAALLYGLYRRELRR